MSGASELKVTLPGGRRVDVSVRGHVIHTDQPADNGGTDTAPTPFELFMASVGACAGIFVQGFCAARQLPTGGISIVQRVEGSEWLLELELPADFPEKYRLPLLAVIDQCSVKKAIAAQPRIVTRIKA